MRLSIPLKIVIAFVVLFSAFVVAYNFFLKTVEKRIVNNSGNATSRGILITLEKKLVNNPKSNWNDVISNLPNNAVYLTLIKNIKLTGSQEKKLKAGSIVFKPGATYQFLNLVIVETTAYKRILGTSHVLAYEFSNPKETIKHYMYPTIQSLVNALLSKPRSVWGREAIRLGKIYGFPVHVYAKNSSLLPRHVINSSAAQNFAFTTKTGSSQVDTLYYVFNSSVLKIGPLQYVALTSRISDLIGYFILIFFIISLCIVMVLSLIFLKNIKKVYRTTERFSVGDFNCRVKIPTTSVLYDLHHNINMMGEKLQQLIESRRNMTRFVAHEIRTPLYTMQLALDSMVHVQDLPAEVNDYIASLQEDIQQLNELVALFLLYSQISAHELKLKRESCNLINWLKGIISHHQLSNIEVEFNVSSSDNMTASFDPKLLRHVIDNLVVNATKFAKNKVIVTLKADQQDIQIVIEDDGPGIADENKEKVFDEFCTLDQSDLFGRHVGLGLYIAKSIIELHHGSIYIEHSRKLGGAKFILQIPR